jgi:hypothetical protein
LCVARPLITYIKVICKFLSEAKSAGIISGLHYSRMVSDEKVEVHAGNLLDTLCARLEQLMRYEKREVMLKHKDGSEVRSFPSFDLYINIYFPP